MFFSRITINAGAAEPEDLISIARGNVYAIHQILWRLFPDAPDANRQFLFRQELKNGWPIFYMVSKRQPKPLRDLIQVESKPYQPKIVNGQRLSFSLRANPVVTKKSTDGRKRFRHDVVMNAKRELEKPDNGDPVISPGELQHDAGSKWLDDRAVRLGFNFNSDQLKVFGYQQHRFKGHRQKHDIRFSTLDFQGILTVDHADRFSRTLAEGIGRAKAFGCGLILVRGTTTP